MLDHEWVVSRGGILPRPLGRDVVFGAATVASIRRLRNLCGGARTAGVAGCAACVGVYGAVAWASGRTSKTCTAAPYSSWLRPSPPPPRPLLCCVPGVVAFNRAAAAAGSTAGSKPQKTKGGPNDSAKDVYLRRLKQSQRCVRAAGGRGPAAGWDWGGQRRSQALRGWL